MRPKLVNTSLDHVTKNVECVFTNFILLFYDKHFKAIKQEFTLLYEGNIYDENSIFVIHH